jgi:hypothetical protein
LLKGRINVWQPMINDGDPSSVWCKKAECHIKIHERHLQYFLDRLVFGTKYSLDLTLSSGEPQQIGMKHMLRVEENHDATQTSIIRDRRNRISPLR